MSRTGAVGEDGVRKQSYILDLDGITWNKLGDALGLSDVPGLDQIKTSAIQFLKSLQDPPKGRFVRFDQAYSSNYTGPISGTVENLGTPIVNLPRVSLDAPFNTDASNTDLSTGTWAGVSPAANYEVRVWSRADIDYLQGIFALNSNGTWTSGESPIRAGKKIVKLMRKSDGLVMAEMGGPTSVYSDVEVQIHVVTDTAYLMDTVHLSGDGKFSGVSPSAGIKRAQVRKVSTGEILASTMWSKQIFPRSYVIEEDDPVYNQSLASRCAVYDAALVAITFLDYGELARAEKILDALASIQNASGSWFFSYDAFLLTSDDAYVRSGAVAWCAMAAIHYRRVTGSFKYETMAIKAGDYLITQQAPIGGPLTGLVRLGSGRYLADSTFVDGQLDGAGAEHNIDAWFVFRDLHAQTNLARFGIARDQVKNAMLSQFWNTQELRLNQGYADPAEALDCDSWGGCFLIASGEYDKAYGALAHMATYQVTGAPIQKSSELDHWNNHYENSGTIDGYKPYGLGYVDPPIMVWAEGTWGAILLKMRMGKDVSSDLKSMVRLSQTTGPNGAWVQVTYTKAAWPYEFQTWPVAASAAWAAMVLKGAPGVFRERP